MRRRHRLVLIVVAVIAVSEVLGAPFTLDALRRAADQGVSAAFDEARDRTAKGEIHITFDDGPTPTATPEVLEVLRRHRATATFFPIGSQVDDNAGLLRQISDDGHGIGNHTWDHDELVGIGVIEWEQAVTRTQIAIERATGTEPACLRPPGGVIDDENRARAAEAGLTVELWTVDPADWRRTSDEIVDAVVADIGDGDVVLLHDGGGDRSATVDALGRILDRLGGDGYVFTALPEC